MVERVEALVLTMSADLNRMEKAYQRAQKQTDATTRAIERRFDQMNDRVVRSGEDMGDGLNRAIASIGIGYAVRELGQYADAWTNLRNTVRQYEAVLGPVDAASSRLVSISNDAGVAVDALGSVFGGAARSAQKFGYDGERVFEFMEAVSKGAAIANTGVAAVDGAMRQLSQSIGSPTVQLGEFNSIIEGTPRLAQAFADGIKEANGDVSELRRLISSGEISGQELFGGLLSQLGKIRSEFAGVDTTIGRAITTLQNAAIEYVGTVDQSLGASQKLAGLIGVVAENLDLLAAAGMAATVALGGRGLAAAVTATAERLKGAQAAFSETAQGLRDQVKITREAAKGYADADARLASLVGVQQRLRDLALEQVLTSERAAQALLDERRAEAEVVRSRLALAEANRAAGETDQNRGLKLQTVRLATHRLQEAEASLEIIRSRAPDEIKRLATANKELQTSQVELGKATTGLAAAQQAHAAAVTAANPRMLALRSTLAGAASILAGPLGTIALVAALTFAFQALSRSAPTAADKVEEARQAFEKFRSAQTGVDTETKKLAEAQDTLAESIRSQGKAAQDTARLEVAAITERVTKNKELAESYRLIAEAKKAEAEAALRELDARNNRPLSNRSSLTRTQADAALLRQVDALPPGAALNQYQLAAVQRRADRASLESQIKEIDAQIEKLAGGAGPVGSAGGGAGDKSSLNRYQTDLERLNETLAEISKAKDTDANKSRAALQAMLDYGKAVGDMDAAVEAWLANGGLLTDADVKILEAEVDGARDLYTTLVDIQALDIEIPVEVDQTDLDEFLRQAEETAVKIGAVDTPEIIQLKEDIGEAVKDGFRQGLQDDNWGEALRGLLASAMTSALDDTLTDVGNWLGDLIVQLGQASVDSGFWTSLANGVGSFFGGGRAAGGPVSSGGAYRVNESGRGEFLFMGNNAGQVLTAAQINGLTAGGGRGGGGVTINAGLTVQGSIDAASWPMVQQAMAAQERRIAQQVPGMIDKRVIDGKRNRQGGYR